MITSKVVWRESPWVYPCPCLVPACEERGPGGTALGAGSVELRKEDSFLGKTLDVGGLGGWVAIGGQVAIAKLNMD